MFDPSKLDLDLDNLDKKKENKPDPKPETPATETSGEQQTTQELISDPLETVQDSPVNEVPSQDKETTAPGESSQGDPLLDIKDDSEQYGNKEDELYNKDSVQEKVKIEAENLKVQEEKVIYDININSLGDLLNILISKQYDFLTIEPQESFIKISFKKDKTEKETRNIKFPVYNQILLKAKNIAKLHLEVTNTTQEGEGEVTLNSKKYKLLLKTVASAFGEKAFIKLQETKNAVVKKQKKQMSLSQIFTILGAGLFTSLLIGGAFLAFVLFNSNNVADLTFFNNLGVDVGSIKEFTAKLVDGVFFSILFIETIFLFVFTFKAILTKKEFKQKKIGRIVFSVFFLILTIVTAFVWLTLSNKINSLKGLNYGKIEYFDNHKYLSQVFDEEGSQLNVNSRLIGPITIRFNIEEFVKKLVDDGFQPQKITWIIDTDETEKPVEDYEYIYTFNEKGLHPVVLNIDGINIKGEAETIQKEVSSINISNIVNIEEREINSGGSFFDFDASDLSNLGKVEWYYIPELNGKTEIEQTEIVSKALSTPITKSNLFTSDPIFDKEVIVGMKIITKNQPNEGLDKIFIIKKDESDNINGEINFSQSIENDLEYSLYFQNPETEFGNGLIGEFQWKIGDKTITKTADLSDLENSSKLVHEFESYGKNTVLLTITDTRGNTKDFSIIIDIPKKLKLVKNLNISNQLGEIGEINYEEKLNEYYINEIGVPAKLRLDARFIKSDNLLYTLESVEWDFDSNGDVDEKKKLTYYDISSEGNHTITGKYRFVHRKIPDDVIVVTQKIFVEGVKKEAILDLQINNESNYVPITVGFDASKSQVKDENIVKFIWDYGDGTNEERDAIVPGHKYTSPGDYNISLTVVTQSGKEYSIEKKLILKPRPQTVKITSSMKSAPVGQGIDFSSEDSEGQIIGYLWKFGDGNTSTEANPTHYYEKSGDYTVTLRLDFQNNNVDNDILDIEIFEE